MKFNCCLSIFGVTDADGIREIVHHCQIADIGFAPASIRNILEDNRPLFIDQDIREIDAGLASALRRLGLSFEWSTLASDRYPNSRDSMIIHHGPSACTVLGWTEKSGAAGQIHTNDTSAQARAVLAIWPDFSELIDKAGHARLHIVASSHEAISLVADPQGLLPGAAEAYLEARAMRTRKPK